MHWDDQRSDFYMFPRRDLLCRGGDRLLHISREAQKRNQMIDSWPTGQSSHGQKKEVAAELLRGALGLQESLIKLGKIEEACRFMVQTSREHDRSITMEEEFSGEMGMQAMGSRRFDARGHQHGLRAARNLRSSRNCVEELRKVIRDSLYRQNLVSISSDDEKSPSSTSQNLSTVGDEDCKQKHETESSGNAASAAAQQKKKARVPNLIARLMGLEEGPPEEFRPVRRSERRKNSNGQMSFFDLEMPQVGKLPLMGKPNPRGEMLQEIKKPLHFKGPLKSGSIEKSQIGSPAEGNGGNFPASDQVPPSLITRPVHSASLETEEIQKGHMEAGQASVQENLQSSAFELPKKVENKAEKTVGKAKKVATLDKTRSSAPINDQKQLKDGDIRTGKKTKGKQKAVVQRSISEEKNIRSMTASGSQMRKKLLMPRKPEKNPIRVKNRVLIQKSTLHHEDHHSEKPSPKDHIFTAKGRKVTGAKPVREPITAKQAVTNPKEDNKEIFPVQAKDFSPVSRTSPSDLPSGTDLQCVVSNRGVYTQVYLCVDLHFGTCCGYSSSSCACSSDTSGSSLETETKEKETELSSVVADARKKPSFHCEVLPKRSHGGGNLGPSHEPNIHPSGRSRIPVPAQTFEHIRSLLLGSPSFLHNVQKLFKLNHQQPTDCRSTETERKVADNSKLLLDCAEELMAHKHYRSELANHPSWVSCLKSPVTKISMNQLVEEISGEIQELGYNWDASIAGASGGSVYPRWERDVKCEGVWANGAWDQGWSEAIPVEEGDGIIWDVEKYILEELVEEITLDLLG